LRGVPVFIADGHHRYTTAMNYAAGLRQAGEIDHNHEANFVMFYLVARRDPGLLILPTHRMVRGLRDSFKMSDLVNTAKAFTWIRCSVDDADLRDADGFLRKYGPGAMAFMGADPAEVWIGKLTERAVMDSFADEGIEAICDLDVTVLHKLIMDKYLVPWRTDDLFVDYTPDGLKVLAACKSGRSELGVCLQATPIEVVERIALAGGSMPHKSTYFHPKPATGMVLKELR